MANHITTSGTNTVGDALSRHLFPATAQAFEPPGFSGPIQAYEADARETEREKDLVAKRDAHTTSVDQDGLADPGMVPDAGDKKYRAGMAQIEIEHVIPSTGKRKPTTRLEYWMWVIYYIGGQGVGVGNYGAAIQQTLINEEYPSGYIHWGGRRMTVNAFNLDLNGILFAAQLACLLLLGPYADYGNWRPVLLIVFTVILWAMTLGFCGLSSPAEWQAASALYVLGNLALNVSNTFYWAAFPGLVRDLPKCIESEEKVLEGTRKPEEHARLDMLERSKLFNIINIVGSAGNLALLGIATGVAYAIGSSDNSELIRGYRVLSGMFGAITVLTTIPWFLVEQWRPGQKLPAGSHWLTAGPKQVWQAAKNAIHLKQTGLYLLAYFLLQDVSGTSGSVVVILQNKTINFSTLEFSALTLIAYAAGGSGTIFINWVQQRWQLPMRYMVIYGTFMILMPNLWGMIGNWTDKIGYHHAWEFWLWQAWNFQQAAWGSYSISYISEVVPVNKAYMYFSLFNTVGKTSAFIGPFISSAIIDDANGNNNAAFYFLFFLGLLGFVILCFVDPEKAKLENARYLERERKELYSNEPAFGKEILQSTITNEPVELSEQTK